MDMSASMTHYMELLATNQPWNLITFMAIPVILAEFIAVTELAILLTRNTGGALKRANRAAGVIAGVYFLFIFLYLFVNAFVFVLAFFLDFFELAFIVIPLLGPAAERLGIDLIWFGVILGVNMQTSFMHPPFGFALFYLRLVAPREPYTDRVSGKRMQPVTT